jgi:DNA polymerase III subunit beta
MRITCQQPELNLALSTVSHALSESTKLPILQDVLLVAKSGCLQITASNLELTIIYDIAATIEEEGRLTLPAKLFTGFVKYLPPADVTISTNLVDTKSGKLKATIKGLRSRANIWSSDASEYPPVSDSDEATQSIVIDAALLKSICEEVYIAAVSGSSQGEDHGIKVKKDDSDILFMAEDGHQAAICSLPLPAATQRESFPEICIPAITLKELTKILPDTGDIEMSVTSLQNQVLFRTSSLDVRSRLITKNPRDIRRLVQASPVTRVVVGVSELRAIVKSTTFFTTSDRPVLKLSVTPGGNNALELGLLKLEAEADVGNSLSEINAVVDGPEQNLFLHAKYLDTYLKVLQASQVVIELISPTKFVNFKPINSADYIYALMPTVQTSL